MSREKIDIPAKCMGCHKLEEWNGRLREYDALIENAPDEAAEVVGTDDMERYMKAVDTDQGDYLYRRAMAVTILKYYVAHCDGFSTSKGVVNVSGSQERAEPLITDFPQCGVPEVEWQELNHKIAFLPLEGEDGPQGNR